jgi:hypothetical protein
MARPRKTVTQGQVIRFRATDEEAAALVAKAKKEALSLSAYVRARVIDKPQGKATPPRQRKPAADVEALARLMGQLGKVGGNLNQIAHNLNLVAGSVTAEEIRAALADLRQLRAATLAAIQGGTRAGSD